MKHAIPFLIFILSIAHFNIVVADTANTTPYNPTEHDSLNKKNPMLVIAIDPSSSPSASEGIILKVKFYNNTDQVIHIFEQNPLLDFGFLVKPLSSTVEVSKNKEYKRIIRNGLISNAPREFNPGEFTTYKVDIAQIYDLQPGQTYIVQANRNIRVGEAPDWTKISSNEVQFTLK
jgi:hypothetical protein